MDETKLPKSLLAATRFFADPDVCVELVAAMRWPKGVTCPHCEGKKVSFLKTRRIWKCMAKECHKQFSVKTFSIFEDSPIALDKWLTALWLIVNSKNGISSWELHRSLGVTQKSAWFMLHRLRLALKTKNWEKMGGPDSGPIEADETFVGGNPKYRHGHDPKKKAKYLRDAEGKWALNPNYAPQSGRATLKTPVFGLIDRETRQVRAKVIPNVDRHVLQDAILENVTKGSRVYTDSLNSYNRLTALEYVHKSVNHAVEYVREDIHTNSLENFWALLKRGLKGTYVCVEAFHLDRYIDEQSFRYNNRATRDNPLTDLDRFVFALSQISGKRLTYKELTGKEAGPEQPF